MQLGLYNELFITAYERNQIISVSLVRSGKLEYVKGYCKIRVLQELVRDSSTKKINENVMTLGIYTIPQTS